MSVSWANLFGGNCDPRTELIEVIDQARTLVCREGNDFVWSGWADREEALREVDGLMHRVSSGVFPIHEITVLFAPTGALQELSLSNGWSDAFIALSSKADRVLERIK
jgi:hypothetical protein